MVFDYIETFYNRHRSDSALDYRSPLQFKRTLSARSARVVLAAAAKAARPASIDRSALAQLPRFVIGPWFHAGSGRFQ
jgi:hypothetical protein